MSNDSPVFDSLSANQTGSFERELALGQSNGNGVHETERRKAILAHLRVSSDLQQQEQFDVIQNLIANCWAHSNF